QPLHDLAQCRIGCDKGWIAELLRQHDQLISTFLRLIEVCLASGARFEMSLETLTLLGRQCRIEQRRPTADLRACVRHGHDRFLKALAPTGPALSTERGHGCVPDRPRRLSSPAPPPPACQAAHPPPFARTPATSSRSRRAAPAHKPT